MSRIEIIDNYLPDDIFTNIIQKEILSTRFPWYFKDHIVRHTPINYQFVHVFKPPSPYLQVIRPLIEKLDPKSIIRCKANLRPITDKPEQSPYHVDQSQCSDHMVAIYYINTNNGYTIFEHNKQKVESIANRLLIFDGHLRHAGCNCTDVKQRVVLNINYLEHGQEWHYQNRDE